MFRNETQRNIHAAIADHLLDPGRPLLLQSDTGTGKTRAALIAILDWLAEDPARTAAYASPTNQLAGQIYRGPDLAAALERHPSMSSALFTARMGGSMSDYKAMKERAMNARLVISTASSVMIDHLMHGEYHGGSARDLVLFDDADQIPPLARLMRDEILPGACERHDDQMKEQHLFERLSNVASNRRFSSVERGIAKATLRALDGNGWRKRVGIYGDGDAMLYHVHPALLMKGLSNADRSIFMSATLAPGGDFGSFRHQIGMTREDANEQIIDPGSHGAVRFHFPFSPIDTEEWIRETVETIRAAPKPCLVAVTSYDFGRLIEREMPQAVVHHRGKHLSDLVGTLHADSVLVSPTAWSGLDSPIQFKSVVVPRVPFGRPASINGQPVTRIGSARSLMLQVFGCGIRSPDASCDIFILDERVQKLGDFIQRRFTASWRRGWRDSIKARLKKRQDSCPPSAETPSRKRAI